MTENVLWKPNLGPQTWALEASPEEYFEIGFGGRRGGGKTAGGIGWLLYDKDDPLFRALIIRKQSEDLTDWVDRARRIYEPLGARIVGQPPIIEWPSGAIFRTGHLKDTNAYSKYVGHEYHRILIEELNLIPTEENYLKLISSCRSTVRGLRPQVMSNFNPSDVGFAWIKKRFGLHGVPTKPVTTTDQKTGLKRIFVPSGVRDNPYLDADPQYNAFLNSLPDGLREAWRDGSWDDPIIPGAFYTMELAQAEREERIKLVPHDPLLKVHTVWDLGIGKGNSMCVALVQKTRMETKVINYYENDNYGLNHYITKLQELQLAHGYNYGKHYVPHDAKKRSKNDGEDFVDAGKKLHITFTVLPRIEFEVGITNVRLMFPRFYVDRENGSQFLNGIRNYKRLWDENLLRFKDEPVHDWASNPADTLRYIGQAEPLMTNEDVEPFSSSAWEIKESDIDPYGRN